jgi:hypothetical protein
MEYINKIDWTLVLVVLFAISEGLAQIPSVKANSVFQLIFGILQKLVGKKGGE